MIYILKIFNEPLLKFNTCDDIRNPVSEILWINTEKQHLFPYRLKATPDSLNQWIRHRIIPKNRAYVNAFLARCGLNINNPMNIINVSKGLSLNDCYWVVDEDFNGTFEKYNLYENPISEILGMIAFTGYGSNVRSSLFTSPEFTTNGMLPKCWHRDKGEIKLYKGGTVGASNLGFEPYSEYYASQIGQAMGINVVSYNLTKSLKKILCSTCSNFTSLEYSYVPIDSVVPTGGFDEVINYYSKLSEEFQKSFRDMLVFDAIICNTDRHMQNFGFLANNKTNKLEKPAPLFDHGLSLFNTAGLDSFESFDELKAYADTQIPCLYSDFIGMAKEFMSSENKEMLRSLIDFKFKRHSRYNLSSKRLKLIEQMVQYRIKLLLK